MSRTYYEWMEAKRKWYDDQQRRRADIPYPTGENIFYQRESNSPYWERRRSIGESIIPSSINFSFEESNIESFIRAAAEYEFQKEEKFLQEFYQDSPMNASHIDKFNILFQSREQYEKINQRIKDILNNK